LTDYEAEDVSSMREIMMKKIAYHEKAAIMYRKGLEMLKNA